MSGPVSLRGYQAQAVEDIARHLAREGRGQLRAACGTGKTLVALRVAEKVVPRSGLTVLLAPTIGLVAQTLDAWKRDAVIPFAESAVCSDDTVTDGEGAERVSTDPEVIAQWMRRKGRKVIVGTYASAPQLAKALCDSGTEAALLVCDEAHRLAGRPDKGSSVVLDADRFPARRRLFLTATPRLCFDPDTPGLSMDNAEIFGPVLCDYSFTEAIADGWLDDYRVAVIGVTDAELRALLEDDGESEYVDARSQLSLPVLAAQAALGRAVREHGIRRAVTFHSRVDAAAEFARTLRSTVARLPEDARPGGQCTAAHVSGAMKSGVREAILDNLRHPPEDGWSVVANARCLGEGIDIPAIDAVLFASPKDSVTEIAQAAGRALRRQADGTGVATIIIPVPISGDEPADLESGAFETVWRVVRAMREHDEALATSLDFARAHWRRYGDGGRAHEPELPNRITISVPGEVSDGMLAKLSLAIIQHASAPWWDGYARAEIFHQEHQHLAVPSSWKCEDGFALGHWIMHSRQYHRKGMLAPDRLRALEKLGMIWDAHDAVWEEQFCAAGQYLRENGDLRVHPAFVTPGGLKLGWWIKTQRARRAQGLLSSERFERLDHIGMIWNALDGRRSKGLAAATAYHAEHGNLDVPLRYRTEDGYALGTWLHKRRADKKAGAIQPEAKAALDELGIRWTIRRSSPRSRSAAA